jgi:hypothetical protein
MAQKMTREVFAEMVQKLEATAVKDPVGYRRKVGLLAALGYGYILLMLAGVLGIIGLIIVVIIWSRRANGAEIKILLILGLFAAAILRALYIKFEKPEGIPLSSTDAAPLLQSVNRLTDALNAPRFHHVLLVDEFNAAVVQHPKLGIFGWQTNYLLVGLPLMQALSPEQFESVIAHELGHLRGGHGKFSAWIYRVNMTWQQLFAQLSHEGGGAGILKAFFNWYAPYFAAYSFALRRADEYEADRCAAQLTSARTAADALCAVPARTKHLSEHYWKSVAEAIRTQPEPPKTTITGMVTFLKNGSDIAVEDVEKALKESLSEETGTSDTHPSLTDRLRSLGQEARLVEPPIETAAEKFLGPHLPRLAGYLDQVWYKNAAPVWSARHEQSRQEQAHLASLDTKAQTLPLTDEEAWERANLTEDYISEEAALPLFQELRQRPKLQLQAQFAVGRLLLERDDPEGVALLEGVMQKEPDATLSALGLIHAYHKRLGNEQTAKDIIAQGMRHADKADDAEEERATMGNKHTRYLPHEVSAETIVALREVIARHPDAAEGYLVRKELVHFPEKPLYIVGVTLTGEWKRLNRDQDAANLTAALLNDLHQSGVTPGETFVVVLAGERKWLLKPLQGVMGSLIYTAPTAK